MSCKVRFAPSPTGFMHVGNARIAIINYLFCRKNKGHFLFRIDDTDAERSKKEYEEAILRDMKWLGISYDSTFRQSARKDRYEEVKNDLIERGLLYKCYESPEELEFKRKRAIGKGHAPVYDRESLFLSDEKKAELEKSGVKPYWRFKLPEETVSWNDMIMGHISYDLKNVSDPVIVKADGTFLYTFSSVVDDFDSSITHIIRGQDHTTNTAVQLAIFNAISRNTYHVNFAHLSLLVNSDGSEFSKRLGSLNLGNLRDQGIEAMSLIDLLATLGSALNTMPFTHIDDVVDYFDITKFSANSPKFDLKEVINLNEKILRHYTYEDIVSRGISIPQPVFDIVHENVDKLSDFNTWADIFSDNFVPAVSFTDSEKKILQTAIKVLESSTLESFVENVKKTTGVSGKDLYVPIRKAITGMPHGPNLLEIIVKLGKNELTKRMLECTKNS